MSLSLASRKFLSLSLAARLCPGLGDLCFFFAHLGFLLLRLFFKGSNFCFRVFKIGSIGRFAGNGGLRPFQNHGGPFPFTGGAGQHAARGDPVGGYQQDPIERRRQGHLRRKENQAGGDLQQKVSDPPGPPDPDRPRGFLPSGPLKQPRVRADPGPGQPSG